MAISKTYDPSIVEDKWYQVWMSKNYFHAEPEEGKEVFSIVIPPPNITGILHMGHILNNTLQDILIRKARLEGKTTCWVPGTDHASIATEAKVVDFLKSKGIEKNDLSRDDFIKNAWEWKDKYGGIILEQLRKMGASCDWERTAFTLDPDYYSAVIKTFIDLYNKGLIYRGARMTNWDPEAKTVLSEEEVNYKEVDAKLYFVRYQIEGTSDEWVTIATTRPETILGDTAICVHPEDERYQDLKGKNSLVPLVNRSIPFIFDEYVDREFGTGALKITPAHDINDHALGIKYNLPTIDIFNDDGSLNNNAQLYIGEDRFIARKKIIKDLEEGGQLVKVEDYVTNIGYSERTNSVIEPKLSTQWFCKMKDLAIPAIENVKNDTIQFHPSKFKNMYMHWMENIRDWCISRQLWWGQRIPAYYYAGGPEDYVVAEHPEQALELARKKSGNDNLSAQDINQDEDVLDTWFSSWLWPIEVFKGITDPGNKDIEYFNPTSVLVTAPEIIFFWVARMAMSNYTYLGKPPFDHVYFTGIVRDKQGKKMSKSLGNSPDPLALIKKNGADGVRFGIMICSPAGNDLLFDEKLVEQGRNFCNKIWNALRLIQGWEISDGDNNDNHFAINWFNNKFKTTVDGPVSQLFSQYNISGALKLIYSLIWDDYCSWYLEAIKPERGQPIDRATYEKTIDILENLMIVLHPFMPFITEEIFQIIRDRKDNEHIIVAKWPELPSDDKLTGIKDQVSLEREDLFKEITSNIRNIRAENKLSQQEQLTLFVISSKSDNYKDLEFIIKKLGGISEIKYVKEKIENAQSFLVGTEEFYVPVTINKEEESARLLKELEYNKGFLKSVQAKLENKSFIDNAPSQLIEKEKKKMQDAKQKIKILEGNLSKLN